tara:strand:+ start:50 stop:271 length:222 start_codon:yes stop_codon:yes gene_type:complete
LRESECERQKFPKRWQSSSPKQKKSSPVTDLLKKEIARDKKCEEDFGDLGHLRQATFSADYFSDFSVTCDAIV